MTQVRGVPREFSCRWVVKYGCSRPRRVGLIRRGFDMTAGIPGYLMNEASSIACMGRVPAGNPFARQAGQSTLVFDILYLRLPLGKWVVLGWADEPALKDKVGMHEDRLLWAARA